MREGLKTHDTGKIQNLRGFDSVHHHFNTPVSINYKLVKNYKHSEATSWGHWDVKMLNGLSYTDFYLEGTYLFTLTHAW